MTTYTVTDEHGSEQFDSMSTLFDGLIMRGHTAIEALTLIGNAAVADLDQQQQRES